MLNSHLRATRLDCGERHRLARDLREDFGARLLNQLRNATHPEIAEQAQVLLSDLRGLLDSLDPRQFPLSDCVHEWQADGREILRRPDITLAWRLPEHWPAVRLSPVQRCYPGLILREFLRNAVAHSLPQRLAVEVAFVTPAQLRLRATHDGLKAPPERWRPARGLRMSTLRAQDLDGTLEWHTPTPDSLRMDLQFPVPYPESHAKRTRR